MCWQAQACPHACGRTPDARAVCPRLSCGTTPRTRTVARQYTAAGRAIAAAVFGHTRCYSVFVADPWPDGAAARGPRSAGPVTAGPHARLAARVEGSHQRASARLWFRAVWPPPSPSPAAACAFAWCLAPHPPIAAAVTSQPAGTPGLQVCSQPTGGVVRSCPQVAWPRAPPASGRSGRTETKYYSHWRPPLLVLAT